VVLLACSSFELSAGELSKTLLKTVLQALELGGGVMTVAQFGVPICYSLALIPNKQP
jgi:hypothetical protein